MSHTHDLVEVFSVRESEGVYKVVRWCKDCGAVVVDVDFDGRVHPGKIVPMMFPSMNKGK